MSALSHDRNPFNKTEVYIQCLIKSLISLIKSLIECLIKSVGLPRGPLRHPGY